jgi:SAM-dependent methyltransferase
MRPADSVLCINVLEHIDDDAAALRQMIRILEPAGHLLLFVPALAFLYNDLDRLAGHHRRYSKRLLRQRLTESGGTIVRLEYFNPVGAVGWWANRFTKHASLGTERVTRQVQLFDRYILPISRGINGVTRGFFGQSLLAVMRRS